MPRSSADAPGRVKRRVLSFVEELLGEAIAHQGHRTGDYDEAVRHFRQRARVLRRVVELVEDDALERILHDVGGS